MAAEHRAGEFYCIRISFFSSFFNIRASGVRELEDCRNLVEGLAPKLQERRRQTNPAGLGTVRHEKRPIRNEQPVWRTEICQGGQRVEGRTDAIEKKYTETDEKYPHIQKVIDEYWNK